MLPTYSEKKLSNEIPINYIWIGPEAKVPGQDTGGPIAIAKSTNNPIMFYCLEEHKKHYEKKFQDFPNITVESVEEHIKAKQSDPKRSADAKLIQTIINTCLHAEGRGSIRDRITLKEAFSFFLLQSVSGYVLDTNVIPTQDHVSLSARDSLCVTALKNPVNTRSDLECWMMYSPHTENNEAKIIFDKYYLEWVATETYRADLINKKESLEKYYQRMGSAMMIPIYETYKESKKIGLFNTKITGALLYVDVPEFGLRKTYSNTHKFEMRSKYEPGMFGVASQDTSKKLNEI